MISLAYLMDGDYDGWLRMAARTLTPSKHVNQAFETHAHVNSGDLAQEVVDSIARDPRISGGVATAGNERVDLQLLEKLTGDGIIANDGHIGAQKRDLLVPVPGEAVFMSTLRGRARCVESNIRQPCLAQRLARVMTGVTKLTCESPTCDRS